MGESESERVDWSNLPRELWPSIGKCLNSNIDVLRFRSTCKLWRSSLRRPRTVTPSFPLEIAIPSGKGLLFGSTIYRLEPSSLSRPLSNSSFSKAWLVKVDESTYGRLSLLDPFKNPGSRKRYPPDSFPKGLIQSSFRFVELIKAYSYSYSENRPPPTTHSPCLNEKSGKAVLFPNSAGTEIQNCMFFSLHKDGKLGFSKVGDDEWTLVDDKNYYADILLHKGQLYVVDKWGTISWIDCSSLKLVVFSPHLCALGERKHLVESCGSLYVVDMYCEGDATGAYEVVDVRVYKLDEEWGKWLRVNNLEKRAFVLSKDCNFSLFAQDYYGCEGDCIYFCYRDSVSMFNLGSSTFSSPKIFWPCSTMFDL